MRAACARPLLLGPVALVLAITAAFAAATATGRAAGQAIERPVETRETPADLDPHVLEAVLQDLLNYSGKDSPVAARGVPPKQIRCSPEAATWALDLERLLEQRERERWEALSPAARQAAPEAAAVLLRRLQEKDRFRPFQSKDRRIVIRSEKDADAPRGRLEELGERPIVAWTPGYSSDQKYALVRLVIPWSIHHAEGTYFLGRRDGRWVALLREFGYYP